MKPKPTINNTKMSRVIGSSSLSWVGYDFDNSVFYAGFPRGVFYSYKDVPVEVYESLLNSDSHGKYFSANIRNNFEFKKLAEEEVTFDEELPVESSH